MEQNKIDYFVAIKSGNEQERESIYSNLIKNKYLSLSGKCISSFCYECKSNSQSTQHFQTICSKALRVLGFVKLLI